MHSKELQADLSSIAQVLNLLLYNLTGKEPNQSLMSFLLVDEHLVDIGDDLVDYEVGPGYWIALRRPISWLMICLLCQDDVIANSFNIYRGRACKMFFLLPQCHLSC